LQAGSHYGRVRKPKNQYLCKVLLCVRVGLIKKTLAWQQILCIPCSGKSRNTFKSSHFRLWQSSILSVTTNCPSQGQGSRLPQPKIARLLVKIRVSQPNGLQAAMITIFCTQVLDLGMVNVAVNPAMYAVKLQVADGNERNSNGALFYFSDGSTLTLQRFVTELRKALHSIGQYPRTVLGLVPLLLLLSRVLETPPSNCLVGGESQPISSVLRHHHPAWLQNLATASVQSSKLN